MRRGRASRTERRRSTTLWVCEYVIATSRVCSILNETHAFSPNQQFCRDGCDFSRLDPLHAMHSPMDAQRTRYSQDRTEYGATGSSHHHAEDFDLCPSLQ